MLLFVYQVWSLEKPDWTCKIDEGLAGLMAVRWSPDGRHILSTADFKVTVADQSPNLVPSLFSAFKMAVKLDLANSRPCVSKHIGDFDPFKIEAGS